MADMSNTFIAQYLGTPPRDSSLLDFANRVAGRLLPWVRIGSAWRGMASVESRLNSYHLLSQVLVFGVPGEVVEIGCNQGETSVVLQRVINDCDSERQLHLYDSFCGTPEADSADEGVYKTGAMSASEQRLAANFDQLQLKRPIVHRGWFDETIPSSLPERIAFAFIDADLYQSTQHALESVYPRLSQGAVCLFGVYWDPETNLPITRSASYRSPGVKKACDEFLADKPEAVQVLYAGNYTMGFFRKQ